MSDSGVFKREYMGEVPDNRAFEEAFVAWCEYFLEADSLDPSASSRLWAKIRATLAHIDAATVNEARQEAANLTPRGRREAVERLKRK